MGMEITFEGVTKRFGAGEAVKGLSLSVRPGSRLALLGPSGCGKTTLLRLLAGLERPDAGRIFLGTRLLNDPSPLVSPADRRIGMVFQSLALWPHMTVSQNLLFVKKKGAGAQKAMDLLEMVGLAGKAKSYPFELSGGEKQRVALARALMSDPEALLLDEPMANLDSGLKRDLIRSLVSIQETLGVTTIYVSHDQEEALAVAQDLAVMKNGKVEQVGDPKSLFLEPVNEFVAGFLGRNNLIEGNVRAGAIECAAGRFPVEGGEEGAASLAFLRAADLVFIPDPSGPLVVRRSVFRGVGHVIEAGDGKLLLAAESATGLEEGERVRAQPSRPATLIRRRAAGPPG